MPFQHHAIVEYVDEANGLIHTIDGNQGAPLPICRRQHKRGSGHTYFSISPLIDRAIAALGRASAPAESAE